MSAEKTKTTKPRNAAEPVMTEGVEPATILAPLVAPKPQLLNEDPNLLARLFEAFTPTGKAALADKPLLPVRTVTFTVDGAECAPGVFVDENGDYFDFQLTMRSLDSAQEMATLDSVTGSGHTVPPLMSRAMLYKMNGTIITPRQREWLWEALDMRGRQLCFVAYQQMGGASAAALGKFRASFTIG
jgi:hypothetical protein